MPSNSRDFGLIVGVNHYPSHRPLQGAIPDANAFEEWLVNTGAGGSVPAANYRKVLSAASPVSPIWDEIDDAIKAVVDEARKLGNARRFYFFFSGHGLAQVESEKTTTGFCLAKWSLLRRNQLLDLTCYRNYVVNSGLFEEVVMFADCCRNREVMIRGLCPSFENIVPAAPATGQVRRYVAYATELLSAAQEGPADDSTRGYFSRALMDALWGEAADAQGGVPAGQLTAYLYKYVPLLAQQQKKKQVPDVEPLYPPEQEPVFGSASLGGAAPSAPPANTIIDFLNAAGSVTLEGPKIDEFRHHQLQAGSWALALRTGSYVLREQNSGREKRFQVLSRSEVGHVQF